MSTLITGNVITDATIGVEKLAFNPFGNSSGLRNKIINGDFRIWQRGLSFSNPTSITIEYVADRWHSLPVADYAVATTSGTTSRSTDVPVGFQYSLKQQRTLGNTSTDNSQLFYVFETKDTIPLQNSQVTLSFYVKGGANFSSTGINLRFYQGRTIDGSRYIIRDDPQTTYTDYLNNSVNNNWARYSFTFNILSNTTQISFRISRALTGTAGADDSLYITGVQLEAGGLTDFEFRPYDIELPLCQRYYTSSYRPGYFPTDVPARYTHWNSGNPNIMSPRSGTLNALPCQIRFPVQMRKSPTVTIYKTTTNIANQVVDFFEVNTINVSSVIASPNGIGLINLASTPPAGYQGTAYEFQYTADAELTT